MSPRKAQQQASKRQKHDADPKRRKLWPDQQTKGREGRKK